MSRTPTDPAPATATWPLRLAIGLSAFEAAALVAYAMAIGIAGRNSRGSTVTATGMEIATYLVFAALIGLVCFGLVRRNSLARTPYLIVEVFVGIVGWTVLSGDGAVTKAVGAAIVALGVVGVVNSLMPGLMRQLEPADDAGDSDASGSAAADRAAGPGAS